MYDLLNFSGCESDYERDYGGSDRKDAIIYNNTPYMIKHVEKTVHKNKIVGIRILLNAHTLGIEDGDVKSGEIVFIGRGDYKKEGLSVSDILPVYNYVDGTDSDYIFED